MANGVLILPQRPTEYVWDCYELTSGNHWVFGLPNEGQLSSPTCGAMPFRTGTGLCSPYCLRGEDWVFMDNWCDDRHRLVDFYNVFHDKYMYMEDVVTDGPQSSQLSNMYSNLSGLSAVYGSDFQFTDQVLPNNYYYYDNAEAALRNALIPIDGLVSRLPEDNVLRKNRIQNFFTDMTKFKCTISEASHDPPGHRMQKELYWWYETYYDDEPQTRSDYLSSLNLPNYYYVPRQPQYRPIQIETQFIGLFYLYTGNSRDGTTAEGYALCKLGDKVVLTQNQNYDADYQFTMSSHYGGADLANKVANLLGIQFPPQRPEDENAWGTLALEYIYAAVWPKYLTY